MYIRMGRVEVFIGKNYVIYAKRSGLSVRSGINGGKEYELLFMGYLCQLSIRPPNQLSPPDGRKPSSV